MEKLFVLFMIGILLVSCDDQSIEQSKVDEFIASLKEERTERIDLPNFSRDDIPDLLKYGNDDALVKNFPRNPLSSFYMREVSVGMYVLWTVESIRLEEIGSPDFYLFASLNPQVADLSSGEVEDQLAILPQVSQAYTTWWNSSIDLEEKLEVYPLEGTDLIWR